MSSTPASRAAKSWVDQEFPEDVPHAGTSQMPMGKSVIDIAPSGDQPTRPAPEGRGAGWDPKAWEEFDSRPA